MRLFRFLSKRHARLWLSGWAHVAAAAFCSGVTLAQAQQVPPFVAPMVMPVSVVPAGFDITGFIQEATLDTAGAICNAAHPRLAGGTVRLNGQSVVIPCNTVLQFAGRVFRILCF